MEGAGHFVCDVCGCGAVVRYAAATWEWDMLLAIKEFVVVGYLIGGGGYVGESGVAAAVPVIVLL